MQQTRLLLHFEALLGLNLEFEKIERFGGYRGKTHTTNSNNGKEKWNETTENRKAKKTII